MKPEFQHDCENCTFLGHFYAHDVYRCGTSIVARYSNEGNEYQSLPASSLVDVLGGERWAENQAERAMVAALACQALGDTPRALQRFESIGEVKNAVYKVKWDMLFGPGKRDIVPDPTWGLEASTAFNHFYIARSLLEQAEHHLAIADAHDRVCWQKFREKQEAAERGQ